MIANPPARTSRIQTHDDPERNPPISPLLRVITGVEVVVLALTGFGLYFLPSVAADNWPWQLTPFTTRFLGAIYLSSLIPVATMLAVPRWSPARIVLPPLFTFTFVVLVVSMIYSERFEFDRISTWIWFALYILLPGSSAWHLYLYRNRVRLATRDLIPAARYLALTLGGLLAVYGIALVVAPGAATDFWPWSIDAFHARMYSAPFLAGAVGLLCLPPRSTTLETAGAGVTQAALGALALLGLFIVDRSADRVDYGATGTWVWLAMFGLLAVAGITLATIALRKSAEPSL